MTALETCEQSLEKKLEMLRTINTVDSAQRVQDGIWTRTRQQRRQVIVASLGAVVAAIGTLHFVLQGDPFGYFALALATAVLVFAAWKSGHEAASLAALKTGASLLASWRTHLRRQLFYTLFAQLIALQFTALTTWVVWRTGMPNVKSSIFLVTTAGVIVFAAYQFLVVRPSLKREMEMLNTNE